MSSEQRTGDPPHPRAGGWALGVAGWVLRHLRLTIMLILLAIGLIYSAVHDYESEHPRPGYVDRGSITRQDCIDRGGEIVDDVCYTP